MKVLDLVCTCGTPNCKHKLTVRKDKEKLGNLEFLLVDERDFVRSFVSLDREALSALAEFLKKELK